MTTKYTPGPWFVWEGDVYAGMPRVKKRGYLEGYDAKICSIDDMDVTVRDRKENARLISAAPDLLEALKALLERYVLAIGNEGIECLKARAAIAKATGEQT